MRSQSILVPVVALCVLSGGNTVSATVIRGIDIDFVTIGNPGNPGDTKVMPDGTSGYGAVGYEYRIGKYEVTNGQWDDFVSAAGAPTGIPNRPYPYDESAYYIGDNIPTNNVSWYEAAQFCNYLTSGDKSQGAYVFSGDNTNPGEFLGIDRDLAVVNYGIVYVIPTENEWYKAAYYTDSGYSTYANGGATAPIAGDDTNYNGVIGQPWDVGTGTQEQNGTFDMMGNVSEWNETLIGHNRGLRGGAYNNYEDALISFWRSTYNPLGEGRSEGFRVASIPEPTTLLLLGLGGLMVRRHRQA